MRASVVVSLLTAAILAAFTARPAHAQKACDLNLPPSGGSYDLAIHPVYLTSVQFPEKIASAKTSDLSDYEIRPDGDRGLLIRPKKANASAANINITTGTIRLSVNLRTVDEKEQACAIVTFRSTTEEEAREQAIAAAVAARTAALESRLAALERDQAARVRAQLDAAIAERAVGRLDVAKLNAVERNDAGIIVWVMRALYLGGDVLVNVEIENRGRSTFKVAAVELRDGAADRVTAARFVAPGTDGALGVVAPGAKLRGVIVVRDASTLKDPSLVVRGVDAGTVTVRRLGLR